MSMNTVIAAAFGVGLYFLYSAQCDKTMDFRKMDSQDVSQYRTGPYWRGFGKVTYNQPQEQQDIVTFFWSNFFNFDGYTSQREEQLLVNPQRQETNFVPI